MIYSFYFFCRDFRLLSFDEDDNGEEEALVIDKSKLSINRKPRQNTEIKKKPTPEKTTNKNVKIPSKTETPSKSTPTVEDFQEKMLNKIKQKQQKFDGEKEKPIEEPKPVKKKDLSKKNAILFLEKERLKYKKKQSTNKEERQKKTLSNLAMFSSKLKTNKKEENEETDSAKGELMYDKDYDVEDSDVKGSSWMTNKLKFTTPIKDPQLDHYVVEDPLSKKKTKN